MNDPNWPTTIFPSGFAIKGNSSCCSRMPGDMAVRKRTASISWRVFLSAFSIRSTVIGSMPGGRGVWAGAGAAGTAAGVGGA